MSHERNRFPDADQMGTDGLILRLACDLPTVEEICVGDE